MRRRFQIPISKSQTSKTRGFTLIELLVVIAVLGVLAAVVMVAINPADQLARGRDAGRKSTLAQVQKQRSPMLRLGVVILVKIAVQVG